MLADHGCAFRVRARLPRSSHGINDLNKKILRASHITFSKVLVL